MRHHPYDHRWRERWERRRAKRAQRMSRDWEYRWRVRHRWHQRWHRHHQNFKYSLGARLIGVFIVLACASSVILWASMDSAYGLLWAVPALLLVTGLAFGMIRHMVQPLHALALGAEAFRRGNFAHRVPVIHGDEIGDLAMRFNQMAADIQAMLDGKRALLLAISHELRSPLTRARLHAELVGEGASRDALLDELAQMRDLITALLESERLQKDAMDQAEDCGGGPEADAEGSRGQGREARIPAQLARGESELGCERKHIVPFAFRTEGGFGKFKIPAVERRNPSTTSAAPTSSASTRWASRPTPSTARGARTGRSTSSGRRPAASARTATRSRSRSPSSRSASRPAGPS